MKHAIITGAFEPFGSILVEVEEEFTLRDIRWFIHKSHIPLKSGRFEWVCSEWTTGMRIAIKDGNKTITFPTSTSIEAFRKEATKLIMSKTEEEIQKAMEFAQRLVRTYREPSLVVSIL